jgi:steroid delta-isomerase
MQESTVDKNTPAIAAHKESIAHAMAGNKAQWLEVFADDAVVQDPVGPSPFDPDGNGFKGKQRIAEFWDLMIGPSNLNIVPHKRIACGDNIAAVNMTVTNDMGEMKSVVDMKWVSSLRSRLTGILKPSWNKWPANLPDTGNSQCISDSAR